MNLTAAIIVAAALSISCIRVDAAEDHSSHVRPPVAPADDEHAHHRESAVEPKADEHASHRMPVTEGPTASERAHVSPEPPALVLGDMSNERMIELMQMEDDGSIGSIMLDELEAFDGKEDDGFAWELQAWYGTDYHKLWIEAEGERVHESTQSRAEVLWDRIVSAWWSVRAGVRHDLHDGPSRTWAVVGVRGIAPYFVEVEAAVYASEEGRSAVRLNAAQEWLITQRWVVEPEIELTAYGKQDVENDVGSGLADLSVGLRVRYEIIREIAPYLGVEWERKFGNTADLVRADGGEPGELRFLLGVRAWF